MARAGEVQASPKQRGKDLAFRERLLHDCFYFVRCDPPVPDARALRRIDLQYKSQFGCGEDAQIGGGRTITLPANLCPPMCELRMMRTRLCSAASFNRFSTSARLSSAVPTRSSSGGPDSAGSSTCVWTSQPSRSSATVKLCSSLGAAMAQRLSLRLCEPARAVHREYPARPYMRHRTHIA